MIYTLIKTIPLSFTALLPVINPIGTAVILLSLTEGVDHQTRKRLAFKVALNSVSLLTGLLLVGSYMLSLFGISVPIVEVAGGLVLAAMGWNLLNSNDSSTPNSSSSAAPISTDSVFDKAFYPFTFPITVGPGGTAIILTLSAHTKSEAFATTLAGQAGVFIGILLNAALVYFMFAYSSPFFQRLGASGTKVVMRLVAFIVVCIGAEISWKGIQSLIHPH